MKSFRPGNFILFRGVVFVSGNLRDFLLYESLRGSTVNVTVSLPRTNNSPQKLPELHVSESIDDWVDNTIDKIAVG